MFYQAGDMISTPGRLGVVTHYGIYLGESNGIRWVIHNSKLERRVVIEPLYGFSEGRPIRVERRAIPGREESVIRAALAYLGTQYNLLQFNCEHFVTLAHEGNAKSPQLATTLFSLLVGGIGLAVWSENRPEYDAGIGRYRDKRGRFVRG